MAPPDIPWEVRHITNRMMVISDVARHLGVGWDLVKESQKRDLTRRFSRPKLSGLRLIAIDETAVKKGHRYLTVVLDLETGAVVLVGDGKGGPEDQSAQEEGLRLPRK